jgi:hypothetical protein
LLYKGGFVKRLKLNSWEDNFGLYRFFFTTFFALLFSVTSCPKS